MWDSEQLWIITNLASSLLFSGKFEKAKEVYEKYRDQNLSGETKFREAFLNDLTELENLGITHPDVEKIRKLLKNE